MIVSGARCMWNARAEGKVVSSPSTYHAGIEKRGQRQDACWRSWKGKKLRNLREKRKEEKYKEKMKEEMC